MDKNECEDRYSESETEEHLKGKIDLYEWVKKQANVTDAILEGWIPETKQRPDIMFKYNGKLYVIEFQCSPIVTEYTERHELYQAAGINDIWILGTEKYLKQNMREKFIQSVAYGFYDIQEKALIPIKYNESYPIKFCVHKTFRHSNNAFRGIKLDEFIFNGDIIHSKCGSAELIYKKRLNRKMNNKKCKIKTPNKYLNMQRQKYIDVIKDKIFNISNINWNFRFRGTSICAYPIIHKFGKYGNQYIEFYDNCYEWYDGKYHRKIELDFITLNINNFEELRKYAIDDQFLKSNLLEIMKVNKQKILDFKDNYIRIMEVG